MTRDLEEMVVLLPEFVTADILTYDRTVAINDFSSAVFTLATKISQMYYRQEDTQLVFDQAIQVLRESAVLNPDLGISYALAMCLAVRFETTLVMTDCEEAITSFDRIVATCSPEKILTEMEKNAIRLILGLLVSRVNMFPTPENLEDGFHRLRSFVPYSLDDEDRNRPNTRLRAGALGTLVSRGTPEEHHLTPIYTSRFLPFRRIRKRD